MTPTFPYKYYNIGYCDPIQNTYIHTYITLHLYSTFPSLELFKCAEQLIRLLRVDRNKNRLKALHFKSIQTAYGLYKSRFVWPKLVNRQTDRQAGAAQQVLA